MGYAGALYSGVFVIGGAGAGALVARDPGFWRREFEFSAGVLETGEFYVLALFLPLVAVALVRLLVAAVYAAWNFYWFTTADNGPRFAVQLSSFAASLLSTALFFVSVAIKNARPGSAAYFAVSRATGVVLVSVVYMVPIGYLEIRLWGWHRRGLI